MSEELPLVYIKGVPRRYVDVTVNEYIQRPKSEPGQYGQVSSAAPLFLYIFWQASLHCYEQITLVMS